VKNPLITLCGKFILDTVQQFFSESATFYRRYKDNIMAYFSSGHVLKFSEHTNFKFRKLVWIQYLNEDEKQCNSLVTNILGHKNTNTYENW